MQFISTYYEKILLLSRNCRIQNWNISNCPAKKLKKNWILCVSTRKTNFTGKKNQFSVWVSPHAFTLHMHTHISANNHWNWAPIDIFHWFEFFFLVNQCKKVSLLFSILCNNQIGLIQIQIIERQYHIFHSFIPSI